MWNTSTMICIPNTVHPVTIFWYKLLCALNWMYDTDLYHIYNIGYRWHHYHGWRYNRLMLVSRHRLRTFTIFSQMPRLMLYKMYASDVHCLKIHTIWHMLISLILATDTLCTTDLYNICYAIIDMHIVTCYKTCHISRYVLRWIQNVDIHSDTYY